MAGFEMSAALLGGLSVMAGAEEEDGRGLQTVTWRGGPRR
jgi:hypothetical protein